MAHSGLKMQKIDLHIFKYKSSKSR